MTNGLIKKRESKGEGEREGETIYLCTLRSSVSARCIGKLDYD